MNADLEHDRVLSGKSAVAQHRSHSTLRSRLDALIMADPVANRRRGHHGQTSPIDSDTLTERSQAARL